MDVPSEQDWVAKIADRDWNGTKRQCLHRLQECATRRECGTVVG